MANRLTADPYNQGATSALDPYGTRAPLYPTVTPTAGAATTDPYAGATGAGGGLTVHTNRASDDPTNPTGTTPAPPPPTTAPPPATSPFANPPGLGPQTGPQSGNSPDPVVNFSTYLAQHQGDPQAAIDAWNAAGDPGGLKPAWYPGNQTIGLSNGSYLVAPGTGGNTGTDWQVVQRQPGDTGQPSGSATQGDPFLTATRSALLAQLGKLQNPTDPGSPQITVPMNAYAVQSDRGLAKTNQAIAEAAYATGASNTGGYQQSQQQAREQASADQSSFLGQLMTSAETQRQNSLNQLLGLGTGQATQEELAGGQLGLGYSQLQEQANRDALLAALGYYGG